MESKEKIKKEFNEFAGKIAKLESLRAELEAMDTRGFNQDVKIIKAKLKNIDSVTEVEREIKTLRKKIEVKKSGRDYTDSPSKEIAKQTNNLKKKIRELEKIISKKRQIKVKKQLSDKELRYVNDIPKLERQLKELERNFDSHRKFSRGKIDSGVGVVVDEKFGDFLKDVKIEISKKLGEKEKAMDERLKADLRTRETMFKKRYDDLVKNFEKKHAKELHHGLRSEISRKFQEKLKSRMEREKAKMYEEVIKENARKIQEEKHKMMEKLRQEYAKKDEKRLEREIVNLKNKMYAEFKKRVDTLKSQKIVEKEMENKRERLVKVVKKEKIEKKVQKAAPKKDEKKKTEENTKEENESVEEFENEVEEVEVEEPEEAKEEEEKKFIEEAPTPNKSGEVDLGLNLRGAAPKKSEEMKPTEVKEEKKGFFSFFRKKKKPEN